ncbi:SUN domain-containing protein 1-like isoform X2 [Girardinichthys multiradiatus]|uniref:SUN domain-containing protein 1-like isoform X2 n=1 Tax=Girardinichthys multiradiatus TaxID=208333 RepID=UPI001FAE39E8|nr:SUN domain-containing protein 1-like isoform X2 [Girardinichthys multiradiatus]XP_047214423.1 SUN domain-containing protein 1-like isoform X2 [Girardinichthys multiradiatus]
MTMDFSQLHIYTPPQCAPENTGYTYSLSSSYSTAALELEKEYQIAPVYKSPKMSRRSLRLQNSASHYGTESMADYSQNHSSSYTSTRKEARTPRSRKQQSMSSSLSLSQIATPRQTLSFSAASTPMTSSRTTHESVRASDVSQLASALEPSHLRQRRVTTTTTTTTVDGQWGQRSSHSSSNINGDASILKSGASQPNGYICKDCSFHTQKKTSHVTQSSLSASSSSCQAAEFSTDALSSVSSPNTSIYTRDRSQRNKTGVLMSVSNSCMRYSKKALAPIVSLVSVLYSSLVWLGTRTRFSGGKGMSTDVSTGVQASFSDSLRQAWSSSLSKLWLFKQTVLHRMMGSKVYSFEEQGHSSFCGSMNVKDLVTEDASHLNLNGSLCDDHKGKQYSESRTVVLTQTSRLWRLVGALWSILAYAGSCLLQPSHCVLGAGKAIDSGVTTAAQRLLSFFWMILAAPVKAGKGLLWFLARGWYHLVSIMSLLNVFFLTLCVPKLWKLLLLLLPLLLLLLLWWWFPSTAALLAYLPAINLTEWRSISRFTFFSDLAAVPAAVPATETPMEQAHVSPVSQATPILPPLTVHSGVDLERLERVEQQLALLWEKVQQRHQKQDQHHSDILGLYGSLREQLQSQNERESFQVWVSSLMEQRMGVLRGELEQESTNRAQSSEQQKQQQESQATRLSDLELLLKALATKTEEMQQKQQQYEDETKEQEKEAAVTAPSSVGVKQEDHDALLLEVQRLEAELSKIRVDLQGVAGCKGKCEQLDSLQETISNQVSSQLRKELQALFFGSGASAEQGEIPQSLIHWLSQRYVSTPDLQAALASIELSILKNISLQLEHSQAQTLDEAESRTRSIVQTVKGAVQHTSSTEGLPEEHVKLIVQNALKLYSQDRTGQVDYALESGGGSILSTRCSETYETKTALMSLFGLPLWYFSQSPRVVIQPDVYPGNCWAFKGSQGYLVIRLSLRILPTSFCLEHIPKALSPTGNITSAPCNFTVFGLDDEYQEEGTLLGHYTYEEDGESLQFFSVKEKNDKAFQIIEVRVLSNWGHPEYTCLYRFRVHGEPRPE